MKTDEKTVDEEISLKLRKLLAEFDPASVGPREFLAARFDAGLAWVHYPTGCGGLGAPRSYQARVNSTLRAVGAPEPSLGRNEIGLGMAAPTIAAFGTEEQRRKFLLPLFVGDHIYCQLFSEPGAGSDLAAVATRAVRDGNDWVVSGQKVWTSLAQHAQMAILLARTDPTVPKHAGLTYFLCDMTDPGIEVRPLRQLTGASEFNEVFLSEVRVPDSNRLGQLGAGWKVANTTLNNERVAIGGASGSPREGGMIGVVTRTWRQNPSLRTSALHHDLMRLWVEAEVNRITGERLRQQRRAGQAGAEGAGMKLAFARLNQQISGFELEMDPEAGLRYDDWEATEEGFNLTGRGPGYRFLRAKGNSIEGGTSEILRNTIAERGLGLPPESRLDKDIPWKDVPR